MRLAPLLAGICSVSSVALAEPQTLQSSPPALTPAPPPPNGTAPPYGAPPPYGTAPPPYGTPYPYGTAPPPYGAPYPHGTAPPIAEPIHPHRGFSLTISPVHLALPIVELTGEIRAHDKIGVAVIAGAGKVTDNSGFVKVTASAYEGGAQLRYYVVGDFRHGMQLGAELLYLHVSDANLPVKGEGLAVGPFVGYKYTADVGFTFDTQLGFEYLGLRAEASGGTGAATASGSRYIPLLNINVGWSF